MTTQAANGCPAVSVDHFEFMDDACKRKRRPGNHDRFVGCPIASTNLDGFVTGDAPYTVDAAALAGIVPADVFVTAVLIRRRDGVPYYRYLSNGTHDTPYQPWSSTKFMAVLGAAAHLREKSGGKVGLTARTQGGVPLGDLVTVIASYREERYSSNGLSHWFLNVSGRARAMSLVRDWAKRPATESYGGNYGAPAPSDLGYTFVDANGASVSIAPDDQSGIPNRLSTLTEAEILKRVVAWDDPKNQLAGVTRADVETLLYGPTSSTWFPNEAGGLSADTSIYVQSALDMDRVEKDAHGKWRTFGKIGFGNGEYVIVSHTCLPVLDAKGTPVPNRGAEIVLATRALQNGKGLLERDGELATLYRELFQKRLLPLAQADGPVPGSDAGTPNAPDASPPAGQTPPPPARERVDPAATDDAGGCAFARAQTAASPPCWVAVLALVVVWARRRRAHAQKRTVFCIDTSALVRPFALLVLPALAACTAAPVDDSESAESDLRTDGGAPDPAGRPLRHAPTEVVLFEDTMLFADRVPELVYRVEGQPSVRRSAGHMTISGVGALVHPAQYRGATLFVRARPHAGFGVRIGHMGMTTVAGAPNPEPGFEVRFEPDRVDIVALASGAVVGSHAASMPSDVESEVAVSWSVDEGTVRVALDGDRVFETKGLAVPYGGFAIAGLHATSSVDLRAIRAVWSDDRPVLLYDGVDTMFDPATGAVAATIPSIFTFPNQTYETLSIDQIEGRSLVRYDDPNGPQGYAVRDLRSGQVELVSDGSGRCNGLHLTQGGTSFEGVALHASYDLVRMTWFSWYAYQKRRLDVLCFADDHLGFGNFRAPTSSFLAFADPSMALDGSMARVMRLDPSWQGVTHLVAPPAIRPYVTWNDRPLPGPSSPMTSHTGAGGPVGFAVRDRDRLVYEEWSYVRYWEPSGGSNLHTGNFGFNLFTGTTDWAGSQRGWQRGLPTTIDHANTFPSMREPGTMFGHRYEFDDAISGGGRWKAMESIRFGVGGFVAQKTLPTFRGMEVLYRP